jgi:phytoene dehydrogenase-like protein
MYDAIIIGSGPNGLVAAATLARQGWRVLVLEAKPRPGGAVYSEEFTLPGYLHDVGAAFFPFAADSPALRSLSLTGAGLTWRHARYESAHPGPDGVCPSIARDVDLAARAFGPDGAAWAKLARWRQAMGPHFVDALLASLPGVGTAWRLGLWNLLKFGLAGGRSSGGLSRHLFQTEAARRVIPGLALHADLGPKDWTGAGIGLVLALLASASGFPVPVGGARAITQAILVRLQEAKGEIRLGAHVERIVVSQGRAVAVHTNQGEEIAATRAILADVGAPALYLKLLDQAHVSWWVRRSIKRFRYGWGTFKMDWALAGPVPWSAAEAREAAVVHAGDSLADLEAFTKEVREGQLPTNPYLVIGQQSLVDASRAPAGQHTLWAYTHVPSYPESGWPQLAQAFADRMEQRIEGLAPGFRQLIRGRAVHTPADLEAMDENLVGGDLGGGSAHLDHQFIFRPLFPYFRYGTPIKSLYLCSASTHPGGGVHGACGFNAALTALRQAA